MKVRRVNYEDDEERFLFYSWKDSPLSVKEETGYDLRTIALVRPCAP